VKVHLEALVEAMVEHKAKLKNGVVKYQVEMKNIASVHVTCIEELEAFSSRPLRGFFYNGVN